MDAVDSDADPERDKNMFVFLIQSIRHNLWALIRHTGFVLCFFSLPHTFTEKDQYYEY